MEAKDTKRMGFDEAIKYIKIPSNLTEEVYDALEAQAEISFKVGYDKALAQLAEMTEECKQMGRREVVEWIAPKITSHTLGDGLILDIHPIEWQAQKREWGIDEEVSDNIC